MLCHFFTLSNFSHRIGIMAIFTFFAVTQHMETPFKAK
jgi:hypothetical protein